jgi:hypothetical protein
MAVILIEHTDRVWKQKDRAKGAVADERSVMTVIGVARSRGEYGV